MEDEKEIYIVKERKADHGWREDGKKIFIFLKPRIGKKSKNRKRGSSRKRLITMK